MNRPAPQRVALVTPFFGRDLSGRKERYAFAYATHLALERVAVEVITTTATPAAADANYFHGGTDLTEAFPVHRFRVEAPDRVAHAQAVLAVERDAREGERRESALLDERLRSAELLAHVSAAADRYDAFVFVDALAPTTVRGIAQVAERAMVLPLLDDDPVARVPAVREALGSARTILCTTQGEAALVAGMFGPALSARTRVIGLAVDRIPPGDAEIERVRRAHAGRPYLLVTGEDRAAPDALRAAGHACVELSAVPERERAATFACARAVVVSGDGLGFAPEVVEAWAYGKAVIASERSPGAAALVREAGGGLVLPGWPVQLPDDAALAELARAGAGWADRSGGWRRVAARTSEEVDALGALDDGRSRDALLAQVAYLYPLVQRQRRLIDAMRLSRFWTLREGWFSLRRRLGIGPHEDPVGLPELDDRAVQLATLGDPYQLFREHHRLRYEDVERMRATRRFLPRQIGFGLVIDARGRGGDGLRATIRSLVDQVYERWTAAIVVGAGEDGAPRADYAALAAEDPRLSVVVGFEDGLAGADVVGVLEPHDRLEPQALFDFALAFQDDADVVYSDEDRIDKRGVVGQPWFKPDWSPETLLTRDYVGHACMIRRARIEEVGGVRQVLASASWYDALLRVTERTERIVHLAQVLYHRHAGNAIGLGDMALAVEVALRRRGETATVAVGDGGLEVRFAVPGDERVCVVIPTRDRAELLGPCLESLFGRTAYRAFEVIVVDNGSREQRTHDLLAAWERREPGRFRVLRDPSPFNYSRLNNEAVRATGAPYVMMLNNDTEVIAPEWMEAMLGQARRPGIGAVGALLLYGDGSVQHGGVVLGILGLAGHAHRFLPGGAPGYHGGLRFDTNYLAVTGAALLVSKRAYEEVGGLDEELAVSYNDVDFCLKLRRAGYRNVFVPRARLHHYESKTRGGDDTPAKVARAMQEVETIRARWPEWAVRDPYYNPNLTADAEDFGLRL